MSDQGIWFKLWCAALDDPDMDNLSLEQWARWAKLGAYIKKHGDSGVLVISPPATMLCGILKCVTIDDAISHISKLKNVTVTSVTNGIVTHKIEWKNWHKYQGDNSAHRVKKFREKKRESVTPKKRREEKIYSEEFLTFWDAYPKKTGKGEASRQWDINRPPLSECLETLSWQVESPEWRKEGGKFIIDPERWIKKRKWEDQKPEGGKGVGPNFF